MKAPPEISLPPAVVAEKERIIRWPHFKPERRPILEKLCNAKAWNQLSRHEPRMKRAGLIREWSWESPDEKWSEPELALQLAFHGAFFIAISNMRTFTPAETRKTVNFYHEKAKQFQKEALRLAELSEEAADHARALAAWHEAVADELNSPSDPRLIAGRHQRSPQVRAFCVLFVGITRRLYGDALYEIVANIATAAFGQDVSRENVASWCKTGSSKKKKIPRKKAPGQAVNKRS